MQVIARDSIGGALLKGLLKLQATVTYRLAQTADEQALVALEPSFRFIDSLSRFHIVHDEELRPVVSGFNARDICETIDAAGGELPEGWRDEGERIDEQFEPIREFFDLTILRGKDMAANLVRAMGQQKATRGLLYCDGYLNSYLARWFETHDVSYSLCMPTWS
jgi:hypothetical protein